MMLLLVRFLHRVIHGLRTGEVCALTWNDINLIDGIIKVSHNVYDKKKDDKGRWYLGSTKTVTGTREIYIGKTLLTALRNYKKKQDYYKKIFCSSYHHYHLENVTNEYGKIIEYRIVENQNNIINISEVNFVFTRYDGLYTGTDFIRQPFSVIHNELDIKDCRFYDLRGSYATKSLWVGAKLKEVSDILGHKNIETTENYYVSSSKKTRKDAVDLFDRTISSSVIDNISKYEIFSPKVVTKS